MKIGESMALELKHEAIATRKTLERVPESDFEWPPHEKSMTMGRLASHVADMMSWVESILTQTEMAFDPAAHKPWEAKNTDELTGRFDSLLAKTLGLLDSIDDTAMMVPWSLKIGGQEVFKMPRVAVMRFMVLSHLVHHRAQLGVYLRLRNIAVPAAYGPSADE